MSDIENECYMAFMCGAIDFSQCKFYEQATSSPYICKHITEASRCHNHAAHNDFFNRRVVRPVLNHFTPESEGE